MYKPFDAKHRQTDMFTSEIDFITNIDHTQLIKEQIALTLNSLDLGIRDVFESSIVSLMKLIITTPNEEKNNTAFSEILTLFLEKLIDFNILHDNCIKMIVINFIFNLLQSNILIDFNNLTSLEKSAIKLFIFENNNLQANSLIVDCICEFIRLSKSSVQYSEYILFCLHNNEIFEISTKLKLIMFLSKNQMTYAYNMLEINNFILQIVTGFKVDIFDEKQIQFLKYLYQIYRNAVEFIPLIPDIIIDKFMKMSNSNYYSEEMIDLILIILKRLGEINNKKIYYILHKLNINYYWLILESSNYQKINSIYQIFMIRVNILHENPISNLLWTKIIQNYHKYPAKTKSISIKCLTYLLNPKINLSTQIIFDSQLFQIICDHLNDFIFEDIVNLLFILQTLICLSINSHHECELRTNLLLYDIIPILKDIQYSELNDQLCDASIENVISFVTK